MKYTNIKRGFTLVELLVVVSIISLLSSIVYANLAYAKTKSVDTRKKADLSEMRTAIVSYNIDNEHPPHMYDCTGQTCVVDDSRPTTEIEDRDNPSSESSKAFTASMKDLVDGHYLSGIPHSPAGAGYTYYAYGAGSAAGAMVGTTMDSDPPTTTGQGGTCRPFTSVGAGRFSFIRSVQTALGTAASKAYAMVGGKELALTVGQVGGGMVCAYVDPDTGQWYEAECPEEQGPNLCTQSSSQDYCLCSPY